ncbi:hypothetical protein ES702_00902 [subsurface metagenome]
MPGPETEPTGEASERESAPEINPEYRKVLDTIRTLYQESGMRPMYEPEEFGVDKFLKSQEGLEVIFDQGYARKLLTPEGGYEITGGASGGGDTEKLWQLFNEAFDVEVVVPKKGDSKLLQQEALKKRGLIGLKTSPGPLVRIKEKQK